MKVSATALLFASLFVPFAYFNHSDGWNQGARLAELHALVMQRTIAIDKYHEVTGDKALIGGRYYSEKAPAIVVFALPAFTASTAAQRRAGIDPDAPDAWRVSNWIATAGSVGLVSAAGGVAFFAALRRRMTASPPVSPSHPNIRRSSRVRPWAPICCTPTRPARGATYSHCCRRRC
jgi:hypothetical protein